MLKITELLETRYKTVREKDVTGKRIPRQVEYKAFRNIRVASGGKRFAHAFVDSTVYYVIYYFVEYVWFSVSNSDVLSNFFTGFFISVMFMFSFPIYYIVFEHFLQRTPGKFLTKTIVIDIYGNKPEIGNNILRNIIRLVPFEVFSCLSERGWHDRWSDTFVVTEEEYLIIKELQLKAEIEAASSIDTEAIIFPTSKRMKYVFLYAILPVSILLYVGILYKGCTQTKKVLNDPELIKVLQHQQQLEHEKQQSEVKK
jgi:uncharacterized RDD family membrane protein YckC